MRPAIYTKILSLLVVGLCLNLTGAGQYIHFSNLHENLFHYNPAAINNNEHLTLYGHYRNQWPGTSDFISYSGSVLYNPESYKSSFGVSAFRDVQGGGVINQTNFSLLYGYRTRVGRNLMLTTGIKVSYGIYAANFHTLHFENNSLPPAINNERLHLYNFSTGFELAHYNSRYGLSIIDAFSFQNNLSRLTEPGINIYYRTRIPLGNSYFTDTYYIEPIIYTAYYKSTTIIQYGGRLDMKTFLGGLYVRQNMQFQFDAISILLGTRFANSSLFYMYDVNLSKMGSQFTSLAAHEVTFSQNLEYKRKSRKKGAIKCPKI